MVHPTRQSKDNLEVPRNTKILCVRHSASYSSPIGREALRELPDMMSAKISDFLTLSPLSTCESDLYYKIHATSLTTSSFPWPPSPSNADIVISWSSLNKRRREERRTVWRAIDLQPQVKLLKTDIRISGYQRISEMDRRGHELDHLEHKTY